MAYTPKFTIRTEESDLREKDDAKVAAAVVSKAPAENSPSTKEKGNQSKVWDGLRIVTPVLSAIAEKPGFISNPENSLRFVNDAFLVITREALALSKQTGLDRKSSFETISGIFPEAWKKNWSHYQEEGNLVEPVLQFAKAVGDTPIPTSSVRHMAKSILENPVLSGEKFTDLHKTFAALYPENTERKNKETLQGRDYFLSRICDITPKQLGVSWREASQWVESWKDAAFWDKSEEGRNAKELLQFSIATQYALLHQYLDRVEEISPLIARKIIPDANLFFERIGDTWKRDSSICEDWFFHEKENFSVMNYATVFSTVLRETGDLRLNGMNKISGNLIKAWNLLPKEGREEQMKEILSSENVIKNISMAKKMTADQKKLFMESFVMPENDSAIAVSVLLKTRAAVLEGLSPLWRKSNDLLRQTLEEKGLPLLVDRLEGNIKQWARELADKTFFNGSSVEGQPSTHAVTENLLREVARKALPDAINNGINNEKEINSSLAYVLSQSANIVWQIIGNERKESREKKLSEIFKVHGEKEENTSAMIYVEPSEDDKVYSEEKVDSLNNTMIEGDE